MERDEGRKSGSFQSISIFDKVCDTIPRNWFCEREDGIQMEFTSYGFFPGRSTGTDILVVTQ